MSILDRVLYFAKLQLRVEARTAAGETREAVLKEELGRVPPSLVAPPIFAPGLKLIETTAEIAALRDQIKQAKAMQDDANS